MKIPWAEMRLLVTLRRLAKALERSNELELHRQEMEYPPLRTGPAPEKKMTFSKPTIEEWNKKERM